MFDSSRSYRAYAALRFASCIVRLYAWLRRERINAFCSLAASRNACACASRAALISDCFGGRCEPGPLNRVQCGSLFASYVGMTRSFTGCDSWKVDGFFVRRVEESGWTGRYSAEDGPAVSGRSTEEVEGAGAFADCGRFGLVPTKTRGEEEVLMETGAAANSSRDCGSWVASRSERNSSGGNVPIMATFNGSEEAVSLKGFDGSIADGGTAQPFVLACNAKVVR